MKTILALGASNSTKSINKALAVYAANSLNDVKVEILDLNDFSLPIYGVDEEEANGVPENAKKIKEKLNQAEGVIISFAEHNGAYSAAFKNVLDWISRIDQKIFNQQAVFLMATSPGARGGMTVLEAAKNSFPHFGANVVASFSVPSFYDNFKDNKISNEEIEAAFTLELNKFKEAIK